MVEVVENESWSDIGGPAGDRLLRVATDAETRRPGAQDHRGRRQPREVERPADLPDFAGNPAYEWIHLNLDRRFGIDEPVSADNADEAWEETAAQLESLEMLRKMGVEVLCNTDPTSSLQLYERAETEVEGIDVRSTWRPDRGLKIENGAWETFVGDLNDVTKVDIDDLDHFLDAYDGEMDVGLYVLDPTTTRAWRPSRAPIRTSASARRDGSTTVPTT